MKLINKDQEDAMLTSFRSNFLKNNTTQEKRYRIIKYFGSLTKMPNINDEYMETEIRAFLDDALSNGHDEAKNWLCAQSIKDSGWNISKWSIDNLRGLYILLNENPETKKEKLTLAVAKILNKLKSNAKTDSAASPEKAMADD